MNTQSLIDSSMSWPALSELLAVLSFQAGFNAAVVVLGTSFLGLAAGLIGSFTLLRGRALMGDALAHSALPGIACAFLIAPFFGLQGKNPALLLTGATLSGLLGVAAVQGLVRFTRLPEDSAIGIVLSVFFGFGIVFLSLIQALNLGGEAGLQSFIYGQTAALRSEDAFLTCCIALLASIVSILLLKEFRLVCFDRDFAYSLGWSVTAIDSIMMALLVIVTVMGLQSVGLILIVALLIVPASAARFWTDRLSNMVIFAALFGLLSGYAGSTLSALLPRLPAGAVIVLTSGVFFFLSFIFAPQRGLLFSLWRFLALKYQVSQEHLLRELYEQLEKHSSRSQDHNLLSCGVQKNELRTLRTMGWLARFILILTLKQRQLLTSKNDLISLTEKGLVRALQLVRNHRLWEEYLISYAHIAPANVDRLADLIEHSLPAHTIKRLEAALQEKDLLPESEDLLPQSVHSLDEQT